MMRFSSDFLEQLRKRVPIAEIIGQKVQLKRSGHLLKGLCPFHGEKTPSFFVYEDQHTYHCYGCGAHGDAIHFIQETQGLPFQEAVEYLAHFAGLPLPRDEKVNPEERSERMLLLKALEEACQFFQSQLKGAAHQYLLDRGFTQDIIAQFRLGYTPKGTILKQVLLKKGFSEDILLKAGLVIQSSERSEIYDRFRDRIMFPILDRKGQVIAFGGRILHEGEPKYLNSPETLVFHKGHELYGYAFVKGARTDFTPVLVVEGYTDTLALHQHGWKRALAPLGTALTKEQIELLWRLDTEPILCFDGDEAGQRAAARAAYRALPLLKPGYSLKFITLPFKEDPASLLQSGNLKSFQNLIESALPLSEVIWTIETNNKPLKTPEQKAFLQKSIDATVQQIEDLIVRKHYRSLLQDKLSKLLWNKDSLKKPLNSSSFLSGKNLPLLDPKKTQRNLLFATLLNHPELLHEVLEAFVEIDVPEIPLKKLRDDLLHAINDIEKLDESALKHHLYKGGWKETLDQILSEHTYIHGNFAAPHATKEKALKGWKEVWHLYCGKKVLTAELKSSQHHLSHDMSETTWKRIKQLKGQASAVAQEEAESL